jgi:DNA repair exonuclease SbcCD nuclease subunit
MKRRYLADEAQARFAEARFAAVRRLAALADEQRCAFAVVAGDVFESNQVERRTLARALDALAAFRVPVFLLPGNHDPLDGGSLYHQAAFRERMPANVRVIGDEQPIEAAPGVFVVGAPWRSRRPQRDLVAALCAGLAPTRAVTRVCVAHGAVDSLSPDRDDPARIALGSAEAALAECRIHYLALGDRHSLTAVGASGRIHYAGTPEPTDFDEERPGEALVVDLTPDRVQVTPHRVGTWRFLRRRDLRLDGGDDLDGLEAWLHTLPAKERTALRVECSGSLDLRAAARLEAILERARDLFASLELWNPDLAVVPADSDFESLALSGFAERAVACLREQARAGGEQALLARDALALLVRLAGEAAPA